MFIRNGQPFDIDSFQVIGENQYPVGWFRDADNRAALGVTEVDDDAPTIAAKLASARARMYSAIEDAVMAVYERPVRLAREYEMRLADAQAYRDAGYAGAVGRVLDGFATAKAITAAQAADIVIAQADGFHNAELALADLRMRKYEITRATTLTDAQAVYDATIATIGVIAAQIA